MRTTWIAFVGASVLAIGCGDDTGTVTGGTDPSTGSETTTGPSMTGASTGPGMTTEPGSEGSTSTPDTTTVDPDSSSSGEPVGCGNDMVEADEVCDGSDLGGETCASQGFDGGGRLGCAVDCTGFNTGGCMSIQCGDGILQEEEACDFEDFGGADCVSEGFDNGTLSCSLDCTTVDTSSCGICGNVIVDGEEACDGIVLFGETCESQGFSSGELLCTPDCLAYDVANCIMCGNDIIDGVEPCDGVDLGGSDCISEGFVGGTLDCTADCALDISACNACGNDIIDAGEGCDGANLGGEDCVSLGLLGGMLSCAANCQYDFTSCDIPGIPFGSDSGYSGFALTPPMTTCDEISGTGTATGLFDDDNVVVPMGFTFPIYGVDYTDINIQSNGTLRWGDALYLGLTNSCLPTVTAPSVNTLYVFWDDLNPNTGAGEVYYETIGAPGSQRFTVQWDTANFAGDAIDLMRMQVTLHENSGQIDVCYVDTINAGNSADSGAEATAGIQQDSGDALQYSCDTPDLVDGTQLLYIPL